MAPQLWILSACLACSALLTSGTSAAVDPPAVQASGFMSAKVDPVSGAIELTENDRPVLRYNYQAVDRPDLQPRIHPDNRKYARARSNYIHPLYGPAGEELTRDWPIDHPHHRGIYWAWPEVEYGQERGDLHALQKVHARPTGRCLLQGGPVCAQIDAENLWVWENGDAVVRERAVIRAFPARTDQSRWIDLELHFTALREGITLARRGTELYGGLNLRLAEVDGQQILRSASMEIDARRKGWAELSGRFGAGKEVGFAILQAGSNPCFPGDWIQYPELNWLQPTFPAKGTRYPLQVNEPLVLRYRLWIHAGRATEAQLDEAWRAYEAGRREGK